MRTLQTAVTDSTLRAVLVAGVMVANSVLPPACAEGAHAIAMHGSPAMPDGFDAFPYVNPDAPKGGQYGGRRARRTFDSLNPLVVQGLAVQSIRGYVIERSDGAQGTLSLSRSAGYWRTVETDDARSYVTFALDPAAHFSDGTPVTAEDVVFSWQLLRDHGRPNLRLYYSKVVKADILAERAVRFDLTGSNDRELPLILGLMPVLAKHTVNVEGFERTTLAKPIGSGPYAAADVDIGQKRHIQARS